MLGAGQAIAEIPKVEPDGVVESIELPGHTHRRSRILYLMRGKAPEDSPLNRKGIDLFVAQKVTETRGGVVSVNVGKVVVEHTPGDEPAIVDLKTGNCSETTLLETALPHALEHARVTRAVLSADRTDIPTEEIARAGFEPKGPDSFIVPAAA